MAKNKSLSEQRKEIIEHNIRLHESEMLSEIASIRKGIKDLSYEISKKGIAEREAFFKTTAALIRSFRAISGK